VRRKLVATEGQPSPELATRVAGQKCNCPQLFSGREELPQMLPPFDALRTITDLCPEAPATRRTELSRRWPCAGVIAGPPAVAGSRPSTVRLEIRWSTCFRLTKVPLGFSRWRARRNSGHSTASSDRVSIGAVSWARPRIGQPYRLKRCLNASNSPTQKRRLLPRTEPPSYRVFHRRCRRVDCDGAPRHNRDRLLTGRGSSAS
jgi:hypothetical protein